MLTCLPTAPRSPGRSERAGEMGLDPSGADHAGLSRPPTHRPPPRRPHPRRLLGVAANAVAAEYEPARDERRCHDEMEKGPVPTDGPHRGGGVRALE